MIEKNNERKTEIIQIKVSLPLKKAFYETTLKNGESLGMSVVIRNMMIKRVAEFKKTGVIID